MEHAEIKLMERILEPEVMDTWEEARDYDAMDFTIVNADFAKRAIELVPPSGFVLDAGTGTARIPILVGQQCPQWRIVAIDLSRNMLKLAAQNITQAGLQSQITLELADAKQLLFPAAQFDLVLSNSLIHHLPNPLSFLQEIDRVLKPGGALLLRDLIRPPDLATVESLVAAIGPDYDAHQRQLFHDSLKAAFTLEEVRDLVAQSGLQGVTVEQSSDRHWTAARAWAG